MCDIGRFELPRFQSCCWTRKKRTAPSAC